MKIALSRLPTQKKRIMVPPIPFERPAVRELQKHEYLSFSCRTNPGDENSTTYSLTIPFFKNDSPEEYFIFLKSVRQVFRGQNLTTGPQRYALMRRVLQGDALAAFNRAATAEGAETVANLDEVIKGLTAHVLPRRAAVNQKRYMRRFLRKPAGVSMRKFMARVEEINKYIEQMPPQVPGGPAPTKLDVTDLLDLGEFACPAKWQRGMVQQGFDPIAHTIPEMVEFVERYEMTEEQELHSGQNSNTGQNAKTGPSAKTSPKDGTGKISSAKTLRGNKRTNQNDNDDAQQKWCKYHDVYGHSTEECKVIKDQIARMKASYKRQKTNKYSNKTWVRTKQPDNKSKENELHSIISQAVERALKKEHAHSGNKRKEYYTLESEDKSVASVDNTNDQYAVEEFANMSISGDDASSTSKSKQD